MKETFQFFTLVQLSECECMDCSSCAVQFKPVHIFFILNLYFIHPTMVKMFCKISSVPLFASDRFQLSSIHIYMCLIVIAQNESQI